MRAETARDERWDTPGEIDHEVMNKVRKGIAKLLPRNNQLEQKVMQVRSYLSEEFGVTERGLENAASMFAKEILEILGVNLWLPCPRAALHCDRSASRRRPVLPSG